MHFGVNLFIDTPILIDSSWCGVEIRIFQDLAVWFLAIWPVFQLKPRTRKGFTSDKATLGLGNVKIENLITLWLTSFDQTFACDRSAQDIVGVLALSHSWWPEFSWKTSNTLLMLRSWLSQVTSAGACLHRGELFFSTGWKYSSMAGWCCCTHGRGERGQRIWVQYSWQDSL